MTRFAVIAAVLILMLVGIELRHDDPRAHAALVAAKTLLASSAKAIYDRIAERAEALR